MRWPHRRFGHGAVWKGVPWKSGPTGNGRSWALMPGNVSRGGLVDVYLVGRLYRRGVVDEVMLDVPGRDRRCNGITRPRGLGRLTVDRAWIIGRDQR